MKSVYSYVVPFSDIRYFNLKEVSETFLEYVLKLIEFRRDEIGWSLDEMKTYCEICQILGYKDKFRELKDLYGFTDFDQYLN